MATLEQQRAKFALEKVEGVRQQDQAIAKYKTQLLKLPARLHNNGLGQTVGYLLAQKETSPERAIYGWLEEWLRRQPERAGEAIYAHGRLIECITGAAPARITADDVEPRYRRASAEARALANWLKRFAEAFLAGGPE